jgi:molecular chaperone Hsp33
VLALMGEAMALTAALATALKFRGSFSLQAKGDGPVPMLLADCTEGGALRGYARADAEKLAALLAEAPPSAGALLGRATSPSPATRGRRWTATRASSRSRARRWPT